MKKLAWFLTIAMTFASVPGMAMVHSTVDGFIQDRKSSEIAPVRDTGVMLDGVHQGVHMTYDAVTQPLSPILNPVRQIRDVALESTKTIVNTTWNVLTFHDYRTKDSG